MKTVIVNGKEYKVIKKYKHYTLCEDAFGLKTCFDDYDLGIIPKYYIHDIKMKLNELDDKDNKICRKHILEP